MHCEEKSPTASGTLMGSCQLPAVSVSNGTGVTEFSRRFRFRVPGITASPSDLPRSPVLLDFDRKSGKPSHLTQGRSPRAGCPCFGSHPLLCIWLTTFLPRRERQASRKESTRECRT